jgi:hypothetical protein
LFVGGCSEPSAATSDATPTADTAKRKPAEQLSDTEIQDRIDEVLAYTATRNMVANDNAAWQIVHGILAFGPDLQIEVDGKLVPALTYLLEGGQLEGWKLVPGDKGVDSIVEPGSKTGQGHEDQWMGYLALSGVPSSERVKVAGQWYTMGDMLTEAQWDIRKDMEKTWTLKALSSYLPSDTKWTASDGKEWTVEEVVADEAAADLNESACGGSHRLTGLSTAVQHHLAEGGQLTGGWKAAQDKIAWATKTAHDFQQPDGCFSSMYFQRAAGSPDVGERIGTTGHTFEFLAVSMSDEQLREPWMTRAAVALCDMLDETRELPVECGKLYHAARGLKVYRTRRFGEPPATSPATTADAESRETALRQAQGR